MILVDTSVWIDHLRAGNRRLTELLDNVQVLTHPFIVGELACGRMQNRTEVLQLLQDLPRIQIASDTEVLYFIEKHQLMGRGVGYIDAHLLAATALDVPARLWSRDRHLAAVAGDLKLAYLS